MAMATSVSGVSETHNPLPEFVFPARTSTSSSAPASFSRASGGRRPVSAAELPMFSFNPSGGISPESGMASPPLSPSRAIPSRSGFHKRGTSEFIGGDGKSGSGLGLMSTSPTKGDGILPNPNPTSSLGPVTGRRGHQHRRSAAISAHDLSFILKPSDPNTIPRGGSAPCSPSGDEHNHSPFPGIDQISDKETKQTNSDNNTQIKPSNRARVGFSDDIQFIPRPLSIVSSESSGTTIRPGGHSVSGSLSSIISASSPPSKDQRRSPKSTDGRPKTAAARLDGTRAMSPTADRPSPRRHRSNPLLTDLAIPNAPTSPSTPKFPSKKWAFFGHEDSSPQSRPTSASSKESQSRLSEPSSPVALNPDIPITSTELPPSRRSSISRKTGKKKQKKVKSWAGSILSRKSRQRSQKQSRRSPTPPLRSYSSINEASDFDFGGSIDAISHPKQEIKTDFSSWVPRHVPKNDEENSMSPIIDLDAALGPFNTPSGRDAEWDAVNGGTGTTKRGKRMHSAAGMGNFGGPGMHYHRRAQSSPEFENPRFGIRHLNSSSTMADVFEEDEEEDGWEDTKASSDKESDNKADDDDESALGIDIKVVDAEEMHPDKTMDWTIDTGSSSMRGIKRKGSGLSEGERRHLGTSMKSTASSTSLQEDVIVEESPSPVEILDDSIPRRPDSGAQSSDSTATPPLRARQAKELAPVDIQPFTLQPPYLTPTSPHSTTQSSFPSPRSPFSYDTQRISTAPSSITDEGGFQSLLLGEPGPELRMSVDDVPSLTSSNSTMTRESTAFPISNNLQFRDGQRSASLSSAVVTRKRSSMASLSRLISSSHGEKSKLSIESRAPSMIETDRKEKGSKSKRISRMMQFWKPKDSI